MLFAAILNKYRFLSLCILLTRVCQILSDCYNANILKLLKTSPGRLYQTFNINVLYCIFVYSRMLHSKLKHKRQNLEILCTTYLRGKI